MTGQVEVSLLLDNKAGTIAGSIRTGAAAPIRFVGWMELTRELESLRELALGKLDAGDPRTRGEAPWRD